MKEGLEAVRRLEGEGGPLGQYDDARRLIALAARGDKDGLPQARDELLDVAKRRPEWSRVPLCLGQIDELEGREERAMENYLRRLTWARGNSRCCGARCSCSTNTSTTRTRSL